MVVTLHQVVEEVLGVVFTKAELKICDYLGKSVCCKVALVGCVLTFVVVLQQKVEEDSHGLNFLCGIGRFFHSDDVANTGTLVFQNTIDQSKDEEV